LRTRVRAQTSRPPITDANIPLDQDEGESLVGTAFAVTLNAMASYLVTGGAGFIGSHLAEELVRRSHRVRVADNLVTGKRRNLSHNNFVFVAGQLDRL
jgi:hypothetical protein